MQSLLLDRSTWDLVLDANRNLAVCFEPYAILQDVASAVRTWASECWYDTSLGLPFDTEIFTGSVDLSFIASLAEDAARTVPGVAGARCILRAPTANARQLSGIVIVTLTNGQTDYVSF